MNNDGISDDYDTAGNRIILYDFGRLHMQQNGSDQSGGQEGLFRSVIIFGGSGHGHSFGLRGC